MFKPCPTALHGPLILHVVWDKWQTQTTMYVKRNSHHFHWFCNDCLDKEHRCCSRRHRLQPIGWWPVAEHRNATRNMVRRCQQQIWKSNPTESPLVNTHVSVVFLSEPWCSPCLSLLLVWWSGFVTKRPSATGKTPSPLFCLLTVCVTHAESY